MGFVAYYLSRMCNGIEVFRFAANLIMTTTLRPVIIYYRSTPQNRHLYCCSLVSPFWDANIDRRDTITLFGILITCRFRGWMDGWAVDVILLDCCNQIRYYSRDRNEPTHILTFLMIDNRLRTVAVIRSSEATKVKVSWAVVVLAINSG